MDLKRHRIKAGLTQKELSEKSGISTATIGKWERRKSEPTIKNLFKIAEVLKVEIGELISKN